MSIAYGAIADPAGTRFRVRAPRAEAVELCLFEGEREQRHAMVRDGEDWTVAIPHDLTGATYGFRAHGPWAPEQGHWFDPAKLLVDPYAMELDAPFIQHESLAVFGIDTAAIVPKAVVQPAMMQLPPQPPRFRRGGLVYEINVRAFTMLHPDIPEAQRGTIGALAHPSILAHLRKLRVSAVELMPVVAWIDERHLPPLGLRNAWGYNPVALMALEPRLAPGGLRELRETVCALHAEGIGVILDLVFNHTGESDRFGGVLSLRGLDDAAYAHTADGTLINDTGCGNTLDFANPAVRRLALDSLRHFVSRSGVDGFRFDLAPVLARGPGFDGAAPFFAEIAADPLLADRVLIAEPWDCGPGGYRLGQFPSGWLEWNDRFRDDVRRFWKGEAGIGVLATRLAGSSDIFGNDCRSVNFVAAHDGFTLADTVAFAERNNLANGEDNRDGHHANHSWNCGVEGPSDDPEVRRCRDRDVRAMLGSLFASTGTIMLTAGDEFGRTQRGNNNAYAQDNPTGWVDWVGRDRALEKHVASLAEKREALGGQVASFPHDGEWLDRADMPMPDHAWDEADFVAFRHSGIGFSIDRAARRVEIEI